MDGTCTPCPAGQLACYSGDAVKCVDVSGDNDNCGECGKTCDTDAGATCTAGECVCPAPLEACGILNTHCRDTSSDRNNCGECYHTCDYKCQGGKCVDCPPGLGACFGECKDFSNDNQNCGGCISSVSRPERRR